MDRHDEVLQTQANHWLEQKKIGLNKEQQALFEQWIATSPAHLTTFEQSEYIEQILTQLSASQINQLNQAKVIQFPRFWAIAASTLLFVSCLIGYHHWPVSPGNSNYHAQYLSKRGEQLDITLPDGSKISLDAQSRLSLAYDSTQRINHLNQGRALFDVKKDTQRPFVVKTDTVKITVLGTKFAVDKKINSTWIGVEHGRVKIQSAEHLIELEKGQEAIVNHHGIKVDNMNPALVDAWRKGRLIFNNTPLNEVCAEFKRYHNSHCIFFEPNLKQLRVSGTFAASDLESFLNIVPQVLPVKIKMDNDHIIIRNTSLN